MSNVIASVRVMGRIIAEMKTAAPGPTNNRERVRAASAYAWLASIEDRHFQQHRRDGVLSQFMFCFLYRLWPLNWRPERMRIDNRRACMVRAAALLITELEAMEQTTPIDYAPEANDPPL